MYHNFCCCCICISSVNAQAGLYDMNFTLLYFTLPMTYYVEDCTSIKISWQCGTKIMTVLVRALAIASLFFRLLCNFTCNVSEALMLAMRVLFCSSLSKVCSCVSEALMLAMSVLLLSCLLNVSSRDSKVLLRFAGLLYSSNAGFSFQSEGMTTLTNRSPRVYHCAAMRTYLPQAHTCTSVHVPHFITNNEVTAKEFSTKLSLSLRSPCLVTLIIHFLPRVIIGARRSIPSHIIRKPIIYNT